MDTQMSRRTLRAAIYAAFFLISSTALAQTGVDDDRVSLPEGPGSLEGVGDNVEIDPNMGSMRTAVRIKTPSGHGEMTPELDLNYSSSAPAGVVGVGWSMKMPSIERFTSRGVPVYDTTDIFAFNGGHELVLVDDSGSDFVYRDRFEKDFRRYTWVNAQSSGGTDYWKVEYSDGSVGYFGADSEGDRVASARTLRTDAAALSLDHDTFKYHLVERVDPFGNRVRYSYDDFDSNVALMTEIMWAFKQGTATSLYRAEMVYGARADTLSSADAGFETRLEHRLEAIRIFAANELAREYVLDYEAIEASGGITRLGSVTEYGLGGMLAGIDNPISFSFDYQQGLGAECTDAACDGPYIVDMGMLPGGVSFDSGRATLVDINGDALPDIVDTSQDGAHQFFLNTLTPDTAMPGAFAHRFGAGYDSAVGDAGTLQLDGQNVQTLDVNGDGYSDLVNTSTGTFLIKDRDAADWEAVQTTLDVEDLRGAPSARRFIDYNGDKRIDVLVATGTATQVYENTGDGFDLKTVDSIGAGFETSNLQLADMNGDGINDPTELTSTGAVRYKVNLGWGRWSEEWRALATQTPLTPTERDIAELEDLNGDSRDDLVIVSASQIKYALNRGDHFDDFVTLTSTQIAGLPQRVDGTQILYADMNANGSEDVVWLTSGQPVQYLELFPQRPNLMSELRNGIGSVQRITYSTAAFQAARAAADGSAWTHTLQIPMAVVERTDIFVTLTGSEDGSGLHDVTTYLYRDGFYDGVEKQFRGFSEVTTSLQGSEAQQEGTTTSLYDLGIDDVYYNGLLQSAQVITAGAPIERTLNTYQDCAVEGVLSPNALTNLGRFPVRYVCVAQTDVVRQEGAPETDWITTRTTFEYDGHGNVTREARLGDIDTEGDEIITATTYASPDTIWHVRLPATEEIYNEESGDRKLKTYYYDGEDFEGLAVGEVTRGFLMRRTTKASEEETLPTLRQRPDVYGNSVETIDPRGSRELTTRLRRQYIYDEFGLFLSQTDILTEDDEGPYVLRRESRFDVKWQKPSLVSDWIVTRDGTELTPANPTSLTYDGLGRPLARILPGDDDATPTEVYNYELGDPFSFVTVQRRSKVNGALDEEARICFDGRGRKYQTRTKLGAGEWLVTGFTSFNARGAEVASYQPYTASSPDCEATPPEGVPVTMTRYDALFRTLERTLPDASIYGDPSIERYEYAPLTTRFFDAEDTTSSGPHADTPLISVTDGNKRLVRIERTLREGESTISATYQLHWDNTNSFAGYTDPEGNRHELVVDLADRIVRVINPNTGVIDYTYDEASNEVARTDARGVTMRMAYDGANRLVERWDDADRDATLVTWSYDVAGECPATRCTQLANRLVGATWSIRDAEGGQVPGHRYYGYDARGRAIYEGVLFGDIALEAHTTYDNADRVTGMSHPGGFATDTTHDAAGRVASLAPFVDTVRYDEESQLAGIEYANGALTTIDHDVIMRIAGISHSDGGGAVLSDTSFGRDRAGNIMEILDKAQREGVPSPHAALSYDAWYRLVWAQLDEGRAGAEVLTYDFDLLDNVTSITSSWVEASPAHIGDLAYDDARPNAVASAGQTSYVYDAKGNMTARGEGMIGWDYLDRITAYDGADVSEHYLYGDKQEHLIMLREDGMDLFGPGLFEVRDGVATTYAKVENMRVGRHTSTSLQTMIYPDVVADAEINAADAFALLTGAQVDAAWAPAASPRRVLGAAAARMLAQAEQGEHMFLHHDHLGSIVAATAQGGELRGERAYYPTGLKRWETGYVDRYGFTGQEEMDSGLVRFKFRSLDPRIGRWTSFDPKFLILAVNGLEKAGEATTGYAYVANNFANSTDPLGLNKLKKAASKVKSKLTRTKSKGDKASKGNESTKKSPASGGDAKSDTEMKWTKNPLHKDAGGDSSGDSGGSSLSFAAASSTDSDAKTESKSILKKAGEKFDKVTGNDAVKAALPEKTVQKLERASKVQTASSVISVVAGLASSLYTIIKGETEGDD